jgi:hypothetical protein
MHTQRLAASEKKFLQPDNTEYHQTSQSSSFVLRRRAPQNLTTEITESENF